MDYAFILFIVTILIDVTMVCFLTFNAVVLFAYNPNSKRQINRIACNVKLRNRVNMTLTAFLFVANLMQLLLRFYMGTNFIAPLLLSIAFPVYMILTAYYMGCEKGKCTEVAKSAD